MAGRNEENGEATRALRVGLIYRATVVDEFVAEAPRPVSVGTNPGATLSVDATDLPPRLDLIDWREDQYLLRVFPEMSGRVEIDGEIRKIEEVRRGCETDEAGAALVPLDGVAAGRVEVGEAVVLLQRIATRSEPERPTLPAELRLGPLSALEGRLAGVVAATALLQVGFVVWTQLQEWPRPADRVLEPTATGFVEAQQLPAESPDEPEDLREPKRVRAEVPEGEERASTASEQEEPAGASESSESESSGAEQPSAPSNEHNLAPSPVEEGTVLEALGSEGGEELLAELETASGEADFDEAIASGRRISDAEEGLVPTGGRDSSREEGRTIGSSDDFGAAPGARRAEQGISTGEKRRARVACTDCGEPETPEDPATGAEGIGEKLRRYAGRFQRCYERSLKKQPNLGGKLVIAFRVNTDGSPLAVHAARDSVGGSVAACVVAAIRRIDFPEQDGGAATVEKTFVFEPSGG